MTGMMSRQDKIISTEDGSMPQYLMFTLDCYSFRGFNSKILHTFRQPMSDNSTVTYKNQYTMFKGRHASYQKKVFMYANTLGHHYQQCTVLL